MTGLELLRRLLRRRPKARIVLDGEEVEGYSLPKPSLQIVARQQREWTAQESLRAEHKRTFDQRVAAGAAQRYHARRMQITDAEVDAACEAWLSAPDEALPDRMRRALDAARHAQ